MEVFQPSGLEAAGWPRNTDWRDMLRGLAWFLWTVLAVLILCSASLAGNLTAEAAEESALTCIVHAVHLCLTTAAGDMHNRKWKVQ